MNRACRALTLIETLLTLALLAAIVAASASWTALAGRFGSQAVEPMRREAVADAAFTRIYDDLATGDFDERVSSRKDGGANTHERVRVKDGELEIDGRAGVTHTYRLDRASGRLERIERTGSSSRTRILIVDVVEFTCVLDAERQALDVSIELATDDGPSTILTRRYRVP